jgi:hypothetical protein
MKKAIKIVFFTFLLIFGLVLFYISSRKSEPKKTIDDRLEFLPQPAISEHFKGPYKTKLNISREDFNFPSESPALNLQISKIGEKKAQEIAENLDFNNKPTVFDDQFDGTVFFWKNDTATLLISIDIGKMKYSINTFSATFKEQLTDEKIKTIAYDFLREKFLIGSNDIKYSSLAYFEIQEQGYGVGLKKATKNNANVNRVVFTPQSSQFELLATDPLDPPYWVDILSNGDVYHAEATLLTNVSETSTKYELLNFEDFQESIDDAVLIGVSGGYVSLTDIPETSIKLITIDNIKLAYLLDDPKSKIYSPVFLLTGSIEIVDYPDDLQAELYLPAIKNP